MRIHGVSLDYIDEMRAYSNRRISSEQLISMRIHGVSPEFIEELEALGYDRVSPDELIREYGADTVRVYTLFIGPPEKDAEWSDQGIEGASRLLPRCRRRVSAGAPPHSNGRRRRPT